MYQVDYLVHINRDKLNNQTKSVTLVKSLPLFLSNTTTTHNSTSSRTDDDDDNDDDHPAPDDNRVGDISSGTHRSCIGGRHSSTFESSSFGRIHVDDCCNNNNGGGYADDGYLTVVVVVVVFTFFLLNRGGGLESRNVGFPTGRYTHAGGGRSPASD